MFSRDPKGSAFDQVAFSSEKLEPQNYLRLPCLLVAYAHKTCIIEQLRSTISRR
jgi:hypothetical protein